jgi:para-nitrobenzyl esterase
MGGRLDPRVETRCGVLVGRNEGGAAVFRGVPYAAPPLGDLRLRPPQPLAAWRGEREAGAFGAAPPQSPDPLASALGLQSPHAAHEDCLFVNVWTPRVGSGRRPVLVWLPGGAFINGNAGAALYAGARLAARGDAVVVSVGYRVGALGFLGVGEGEGGANFGLQDQLAALRWVRDEIHGFGGDPENVTVFGESAGAGSLVALLAMPRSRGLLRRAIVQSAAPEGVISLSEASSRAERLLEKLSLSAGDLDGLRAAPVDQILEAQQALLAEGPWETGMLFAPVVEGDLLPLRPSAALRSGAAREVELLIGSTRDEMRLYAGAPFEPADNQVLTTLVSLQLPGQPDTRGPRAARLVDTYRAARARRGESSAPADLFWAILTDLHLRVPGIRLAEDHAAHQPSTRMYLFTWESPARGGAFGACHALDLPFVFGSLDAPGMEEFAGSGESAEGLAENAMDAWVGFARCGDPAHPGLGAWPVYEPGRRATMELGARCGLLEAPREEERAAWDEAWPRPKVR